MPLGIPKVPFRGPGDEEANWVDIYRLHRERLVFLGDEVNSENSNHVTNIMVFLTIENSKADIFFFLNSRGGGLGPGASLFDLIEALEPDVQTICMGVAASVASFLLSGGEATKRVALPHALRQ
uniref:ATP-dependent Clp protease proteolytic subunit n=1 Tax=Komaroffia diversifolia TaxID=555468 RepID=A0AAU6QCH2_9MAGN